MQRTLFEEEMNRFEAEIGNGSSRHNFNYLSSSAPRPQSLVPHHSQVPSDLPPPPPPSIVLNSRIKYSSEAATKPAGSVVSASPTIYSAPPRKTAASVNMDDDDDDDDEDILAKLQKYENEVRSESKKSSKKSSSTGGNIFKPTSVTASEISKKAKQVAQIVKNTPSPVLGTPANSSSHWASSSSTTGHSSTLPTGVKAPPVTSLSDDTVKKAKKQKRNIRTGGGQVWEDESLKEWDPSDFRIFCGDLGNDVTDEILSRTFGRYPSFQKAKVVRDKKTNKTKGYGFVSFKDPMDFTKAMREVNGKYVGSRPIKMRKSNWRDRNIDVAKQKQKLKQQMGYKW